MEHRTLAHQLRLARSPGDQLAAGFLLFAFALFLGSVITVGNIPVGFAWPAALVLFVDVIPWVHATNHRICQSLERARCPAVLAGIQEQAR